jgi:carbonic anhydrase
MFPRPVMTALREAAFRHGRHTEPAMGIGCMDPRMGPLVDSLRKWFPGLYMILNAGGRCAPFNAEYCDDAQGAIDGLLVNRGIKVFFVLGHEDCAFCAATRTVNSLHDGHFKELVARRGCPHPTDLEHAKQQLINVLSNPQVERLWRKGDLQVVGYFLTKTGTVRQYDFTTGQYGMAAV